MPSVETEQDSNLVLPSRLLTYADTKSRDPQFVERRTREGAAWTLAIRRLDGSVEEFVGVDWVFKSKWGRLRPVIQTDPRGKPTYDTFRIDEAAGVIAVVWGLDEIGKVRVGVISQERQVADNPFGNDQAAPVFEQTPMGLAEKIGDRLETPKETAIREAREESGITVVKSVSRPKFPKQNAGAAYFGSWDELVFVRVDLKAINQVKFVSDEIIYKVEFIKLQQLFRDIRNGISDRGIARDAVSNSAYFIWLSNLCELYKQAKQEDLVK